MLGLTSSSSGGKRAFQETPPWNDMLLARRGVQGLLGCASPTQLVRAYLVSRILTTNLPFEEWTEILGSERLTDALLDKLTHLIEANGES